MAGSAENENRSLKRILAVLRAFKGGERKLNLTELSAEAGLNKATTLRIARGLGDEGLLKRDQAGNFSISYGLLALTLNKAGGDGLVELALAHLEAARDACGETVQLNVVTGLEVTVLARAISAHSLRWDQPPGHRSPIYAGAASLAILAFLDARDVLAMLDLDKLVLPGSGERINARDFHANLEAARRDGFIVTSGHRVAGGWGVGAPVFDGSGEVVASISANGPLSRLAETSAQTAAITAARTAARSLSLDLRKYGPNGGDAL